MVELIHSTGTTQSVQYLPIQVEHVVRWNPENGFQVKNIQFLQHPLQNKKNLMVASLISTQNSASEYILTYKRCHSGNEDESLERLSISPLVSSP
jgi:hypothetical protein